MTYLDSVDLEKRRERKRESTRKWRMLNPEKSRESEIRYREANREKIRERSRAWHAANGAAWRAANIEKLRESARNWYAANAEKARWQARAHARKRAGLPEPTRPQPASCECCGGPAQGIGKQHGTLHLDHDHKTGAFRGWLCSKCNHALGLLGDDIAGVDRARSYLLKHAACNVQNAFAGFLLDQNVN